MSETTKILDLIKKRRGYADLPSSPDMEDGGILDDLAWLIRKVDTFEHEIKMLKGRVRGAQADAELERENAVAAVSRVHEQAAAFQKIARICKDESTNSDLAAWDCPCGECVTCIVRSQVENTSELMCESCGQKLDDGPTASFRVNRRAWDMYREAFRTLHATHSRLREILRLDRPWPVNLVLRQLASWIDPHTISTGDALGHELAQDAITVATQIADDLEEPHG